MVSWMINCKEHSKLVSHNMDRSLSFWERVLVKMHEWICPACNQFGEQLKMIRQACRSSDPEISAEENEACRLSKEASERIKVALTEALPGEKGTS